MKSFIISIEAGFTSTFYETEKHVQDYISDELSRAVREQLAEFFKKQRIDHPYVTVSTIEDPIGAIEDDLDIEARYSYLED